jgi:hypothetical protein
LEGDLVKEIWTSLNFEAREKPRIGSHSTPSFTSPSSISFNTKEHRFLEHILYTCVLYPLFGHFSNTQKKIMTSYSANDDPKILNDVYLAGKSTGSRWDISCTNGFIDSIAEHVPSTSAQNTNRRFLAPSLCHPHIHLDKCFLLSHPKYADLKIKDGDFAEAMRLTSEAKSRFEHDDLIERGRALIEESVRFGVTHMRAFVEVDQVVGLKCLEAGLALKNEFNGRCYVQICVFAQDPIFSYDDGGEAMRCLLEEAASRPGVEVIGSTPYVEENGDHDLQIKNMEWTINKAKQFKLHLDFHIDYNLDSSKRAMVLEAIRLLHSVGWSSDPDSPQFRSIVFGHCTRLTLFSNGEWLNLRDEIRGLPISFVGLPTSDLFMMGRPSGGVGGGQRARGTLQIPQMIQKYGLNAAIGINNVGNAFTPQGSCDPLSLASLGVGVYHAGTEEDAGILLVSGVLALMA